MSFKKMKYGLMILCCASLVCVNPLSWSHYYNYDDVASSNASMTSSLIVRSKLDCARSCRADASCRSFFYNNVTGHCSRQQSMLFAGQNDATQEIGRRFYRLDLGAICPDSVTYFADGLSSTCYRLDLSQTKSWTGAKKDCEDSGEQLVVLDARWKASFILDFLNEHYNASSKDIYVGAKAVETNSGYAFEWLNGKLVENDTCQWRKNEPGKNISGWVMALRKNHRFECSAAQGNAQRHFMCERPFFD